MANGGLLILLGLIINYVYYAITDEYIFSGTLKTALEILAVIGVIAWIYLKIK